MLLKGYLRNITWGNFLAQFSEQIALAAAPIIAVIWLGATASHTAWLQAIQTLPFLIFAIPAGLLVDRMSRRHLMILVELIRTLILSMLLLLLMVELLTFNILMILGFMAAVGTVCYSVAMPAYIPTIIPQESLMDINRWLELVRSIAFSAGPTLCGLIVAYLGMPMAYVIAILFSITTLLFLYKLPKDPVIKSASTALVPKESIKQSLLESWHFIYDNHYLRPILLTALFFNSSWFIIQGIFIAYAINTMGFSVQKVGIILGFYGFGMLLGALIVKLLLTKISVGYMIVLGPLGGFLGAITILLTIWFPNVALAGIGYFSLGFGPTIWAITTLSLRQVITPSKMLGRVNAIILTVTAGTRPIGAGIGAILAATLTIESCLWLASIGFSVQLLIIICSKIPALKTLADALPITPSSKI